ncbi:trichohyalin-like [Paramacrobiotus metropolitanus]|uniref:trichohyalin-like n=1 Tax=Paramacrobiotus metropolitanus TaxID=2943436 RepID=UPI002445CD4C|nr:trichohyalin-like [Paramacrobiotus metropolitanus]
MSYPMMLDLKLQRIEAPEGQQLRFTTISSDVKEKMERQNDDTAEERLRRMEQMARERKDADVVNLQREREQRERDQQERERVQRAERERERQQWRAEDKEKRDKWRREVEERSEKLRQIKAYGDQLEIEIAEERLRGARKEVDRLTESISWSEEEEARDREKYRRELESQRRQQRMSGQRQQQTSMPPASHVDRGDDEERDNMPFIMMTPVYRNEPVEHNEPEQRRAHPPITFKDGREATVNSRMMRSDPREQTQQRTADRNMENRTMAQRVAESGPVQSMHSQQQRMTQQNLQRMLQPNQQQADIARRRQGEAVLKNVKYRIQPGVPGNLPIHPFMSIEKRLRKEQYGVIMADLNRMADGLNTLAQSEESPEKAETCRAERWHVLELKTFLELLRSNEAENKKRFVSYSEPIRTSLSPKYVETWFYDRFAATSWITYESQKDGTTRWENRYGQVFKLIQGRFRRSEEPPLYFNPNRFFPDDIAFWSGDCMWDGTYDDASREYVLNMYRELDRVRHQWYADRRRQYASIDMWSCGHHIEMERDIRKIGERVLKKLPADLQRSQSEERIRSGDLDELARLRVETEKYQQEIKRMQEKQKQEEAEKRQLEDDLKVMMDQRKKEKEEWREERRNGQNGKDEDSEADK